MKGMKLDVYEVEHEELIAVSLSGEDLRYIMVDGKITIHLNKDFADRLCFHVGSLLQDMERRNEVK